MKRLKLIRLRERKGLSQADVAAALHRTIVTYRRLEAGKIPLMANDYCALCKVLGCSPDEIVEDSNYLKLAHHLKSSKQSDYAEVEIIDEILRFRKNQERRIVALIRQLVTFS